jgi:membrane protease subunit HflK
MALNDPQWGKRGSGGDNRPPDLDEMWRNFTRRLNAMLGRRGGAGGPSPAPQPGEPPSLRQIGGGAVVLIGLILAAWLASGFYIVVEGQRGVVLTFGRFSEVTNPGLRWRAPYPIQSHEIVDLTGVRTVEVGFRNNNVKSKMPRESLMLTDDENIIDIQFAVQWYLKDPQDFLFNNRKAEDTVQQAAETAFREAVGRTRMDVLLSSGKERVAQDSQKIMQEILDRYRTGITVSKVTMQNAQPPEQVQASFADAVRAQQDLDRQKNEGQAYYNDVVPKARGTAARLSEEAIGYRQRVVDNAEGEASRFKSILAEYSKAPQVTRERLYLDTMQQIMSSTSKVLLDARAGSPLLYLPLDKVVQMSGAPATLPDSLGQAPHAAAPPADTTPAAPPAPAQDLSSRSRDALRSRDRVDR